VNNATLATEATKNTIENTVNWYLADKLQDPITTIATKKFLTTDNKLIYLTHCNVAEVAVPRIKVQVFERVAGGVRETGYQIFSDHRMTKFVNDMIFGTKPAGSGDQVSDEVSEAEATELIQVMGALGEARQTL